MTPHHKKYPDTENTDLILNNCYIIIKITSLKHFCGHSYFFPLCVHQSQYPEHISAALQICPLAQFVPRISLIRFQQEGSFRVESLSHCKGTTQVFASTQTSFILTGLQVILVLTVRNYFVLNHKKRSFKETHLRMCTQPMTTFLYS